MDKTELEARIENSKVISAIQITSFSLFILVTMGTSLFTYLGLASELLETIIFFSLILGLEGFKTFSIVQGNRYSFLSKQIQELFKDREQKYKKKAVGFYIAYGFCAWLSIMGSLFFTLTSVDRKESTIELTMSTTTIDRYNSELYRLRNKVAEYEKEKTKYMELDIIKYNNDIRRVQKLIDPIEKQISDYEKKIEDEEAIKKVEVKQGVQEAKKRTPYVILAETFRNKISEKIIRLILLLALSIGAEWGIIKTAPHPRLSKYISNEDPIKKKAKEPVEEPKQEAKQEVKKENKVEPKKEVKQEKEIVKQDIIEEDELANIILSEPEIQKTIELEDTRETKVDSPRVNISMEENKNREKDKATKRIKIPKVTIEDKYKNTGKVDLS